MAFDFLKKKDKKKGLKIGIDVSEPARPLSQGIPEKFREAAEKQGGFFRDFTKEGAPIADPKEFQRLNLERFSQREVLPSGKLAPLSEQGLSEQRAFERAEEFFGESKEKPMQKRERTAQEFIDIPEEQIRKETQREKLFDFSRGFNDFQTAISKGKLVYKEDAKGINKGINQLADITAKTITGLGVVTGSIATFGLAPTVAGLGVIAGIDATATWGAADNISSSIPFQLNAIVDGVRQGAINQGEAEELVNQAEKTQEFVTKAVNESTRKNPILWPARKRYQTIVENNDAQIELKKRLILG